MKSSGYWRLMEALSRIGKQIQIIISPMWGRWDGNILLILTGLQCTAHYNLPPPIPILILIRDREGGLPSIHWTKVVAFCDLFLFLYVCHVVKNSFLHQRCGRGMAREINHVKCIVRLRIFVFRCICSLLSVRLRTEENMTWQILLTVAHFAGAGGAAGADTETPGHFIFPPPLSVMYCSNK